MFVYIILSIHIWEKVNANFIVSETSSIHNISFEKILGYEWNQRVWRFERIWWMKNASFSENKYNIQYPKGSYKPNWKVMWWAGFIYDIPNLGSTDTVVLEYNITIPENFEFNQWWKLPGLCGGDCPSGWANTDNWFSARMMWREWGQLEIYGYFSDNDLAFWKSFGRGMYIVTPWNTYKITQEIQLNTPWFSDGIMKIYVNNEIKYFNDHASYRDNYSIQANRFMFSTFFWWGGKDWATKINTNMIFSDIKVKY